MCAYLRTFQAVFIEKAKCIHYNVTKCFIFIDFLEYIAIGYLIFHTNLWLWSHQFQWLFVHLQK